MADQSPQNFENHTRRVPLFHFVLMPILFVNLFWRIYVLWTSVSNGYGRREAGANFALALAFIGLAMAARVFALQAQDRVIRLEEHLRWKGLLAPDSYKRIGEISRGQLIAIRFAPDEEVSGLVARVLNGELKEPKAVKGAIKNWRPDHHRL
jgi:hypothetical protein